MEPDDIPLHDLLDAGDQAGAGPDSLRAIVARAGRHRRRMAAGGMVVALLVGGAVGYAVSNHSSSSTQTATAGALTPAAAPQGSATTGSGQSPTASPAIGVGVAPGDRLARLFSRTTNGGVTIRVFRTNLNVPAIMPATCLLGLPQLQVEVSTAQMVGTAMSGYAPAAPTKPLNATEVQVLGGPEGDPTAVVTVATGPGVREVRVSFTGGATDSMAPVGGWVALAGSVPADAASGGSLGTLTALDRAGRALSAAPLTQIGYQFGNSSTPCGVSCPASAKPAVPGATGIFNGAPSTASSRASTSAGAASPPDQALSCSPPCGSLPGVALPSTPAGGAASAPTTLPAKADAAAACPLLKAGGTGSASGSGGSAGGGVAGSPGAAGAAGAAGASSSGG